MPTPDACRPASPHLPAALPHPPFPSLPFPLDMAREGPLPMPAAPHLLAALPCPPSHPIPSDVAHEGPPLRFPLPCLTPLPIPSLPTWRAKAHLVLPPPSQRPASPPFPSLPSNMACEGPLPTPAAPLVVVVAVSPHLPTALPHPFPSDAACEGLLTSSFSCFIYTSLIHLLVLPWPRGSWWVYAVPTTFHIAAARQS